jgi:hypothetical protein
MCPYCSLYLARRAPRGALCGLSLLLVLAGGRDPGDTDPSPGREVGVCVCVCVRVCVGVCALPTGEDTRTHSSCMHPHKRMYMSRSKPQAGSASPLRVGEAGRAIATQSPGGRKGVCAFLRGGDGCFSRPHTQAHKWTLNHTCRSQRHTPPTGVPCIH